MMRPLIDDDELRRIASGQQVKVVETRLVVVLEVGGSVDGLLSRLSGCLFGVAGAHCACVWAGGVVEPPGRGGNAGARLGRVLPGR